MPRAATIKDPYIRQYLRESQMPTSSEMVVRGILNRWFDFLQGGACSDKCCADRQVKATDLFEATRADVVDYTFHLRAQGKAVSTVNDFIVKCRAYYTWAVRVDMNRGNPNPFDGVKNSVPVERILPVITDDVIAKLLKACDNRKGEKRDRKLIARDKAIISVLRWTGMRRSEVAGLNFDQYQYIDGRPLLLLGEPKNGKQRIAGVRYECATLVDRYLLDRGEADGPLFLPQRGERLTPAGITQLFDRACKRAGVEKSYGIHSFRRCFIIEAKRNGMSDSNVMEIVGHGNVQQLRRYTKAVATELALDEYFEKMGGEPKAEKVRGPQPDRYGKKVA
jgi:site-specific recombinase XerD